MSVLIGPATLCSFVLWGDPLAKTNGSAEPTATVAYLLFLGIVSSLSAIFLNWVFYRFRVDTVIPWYQKQLYRGVLIDGQWKGKRNDGDTEYGFTIRLIQSGHQVSGIFTAENRRDSERNTTKSFRLVGEISNSCVLLRYAPAEPHIYGTGAFLLQVFDGGRVLKGGMLYFRTRSGDIGSVHDLVLLRSI
jgi:hypothetical protein